MTLPAAASLLFVVLPWREALMLLGGIGVLAAIVIFMLIPRFAAEAAAPRKAETGAAAASRLSQFGFPLLLSVGVIDSATRMAFLTFLPFVLTAKGASLPTVGLALTLVFAGGAAGKLVCAFIGARIGAVATVWLTEAVTALGIVALLPLSLEPRCCCCRWSASRSTAPRRCSTARCRNWWSRRGASAPSAFSTPAPSAPARCRRRSTVCSATRSACRRR